MEIELIDLISPPASPVQRADTDDCIDLVSPSPTPALGVKSPAAAASSASASAAAASSGPSTSGAKADAAEPSTKALGKRKALLPLDEELEPASDSEDEVTVAPPRARALQEDVRMADDNDEELEFVGRTGANALMDFPHARALRRATH